MTRLFKQSRLYLQSAEVDRKLAYAVRKAATTCTDVYEGPSAQIRVLRRVDPETGEVLGTETPDTATPAKPSKTDLLDAGRYWVRQYGARWSYDRHQHMWRDWTGTHHRDEPRPSTLLDRQAMDVLREINLPVSSISRIDGVIRAAASLSVRSFDPPVGAVNFSNGTLNTVEWSLQPHNAADGFTYCLDYAYVPGPYPKIAAFLAQTIPDADAVAAYMIHLGLALLGDLRMHKTLILIGPPRSGKSTALALANAVCGHELVSNAGAELFSRETEGLRSRAAWNTRRIVTLEELPVEALRNEEIIKAMTAHGGVPMRQMWQKEALDNRWLPKLLMATNEKPRYSDRTGALTKRIIAVSCPNGRPDTALNPFLLDTLLPDLPGFAAACLQMATAVVHTGRSYPMSAEMHALLAEIEQQGDSLKAWLRDCCVLDPDTWQTTDALYGSYKSYCELNGNRSMAKERFTSAIRERYPALQPKAHRVHGTTVPQRCLDGIRLVATQDTSEDF